MVVTLSGVVLGKQNTPGKKDSPPGQENKQEVKVNVGRVDKVLPGKIQGQSRGKKFEVNTDQNTQIVEKPSGKKLNLGQLKRGDQIATIADPNATTPSAKLVLVKQATDSAKPQKRRAVYGLVRQIDGNILTVSHPIKDNPRYKVGVAETTTIKIKGLVSPTVADIKVDDRVASVGNWLGDVLVAKRVHVIPGKATGLFGRIATDSATPSATLSASPSADGL